MNDNYQTAIIKKIITETPRVKSFILDTAIHAQPGQYVMVWWPRDNEKPFGVVVDSPLTLAIAHVGPVTEKIHTLKVGDKLTFRGPYGKGFRVHGKKFLLVAGGYGFVPLYFLASTLSPGIRSHTMVVIGAKTKTELPYIAKFKALGCTVRICTDDGSAGVKGFTTDTVERLLTESRYDGVYTCGPEIMMKKIASLCRIKKIPCQVSLERMFKCGGMGICGECSLHGKLVCKDGPVFNGSILL